MSKATRVRFVVTGDESKNRTLDLFDVPTGGKRYSFPDDSQVYKVVSVAIAADAHIVRLEPTT
jgi:hypothetical protein